ncbi:peptidase MA family metallohydrolase [Anaeroselena agilis]|uniref:Peptidase MA-like domain-containing protein n=1 Tax=Anaeroselena agilis TaxID=3063788 RepID=A0ABU3P1M8_9FIRM|nr:hypothetical protein [Selenomonadales bacterium 4137-cl]
MIILTISVIAVLGLAAAALFPAPLTPRMLLYPVARQAAQAKMNYETRQMAAYETPHFIIKYSPADQTAVAMVAEAAEAAYTPVTKALGYAPPAKTLVILYRDRSELNRNFGWSGDQSAMGVYWGGVIQVLSPRAWLKDGADAEFIHSGPMVHEYTHLVFDHLSRGNYPRWFTEGLAQYLEYKVNGYEWRTAANSLHDRGYTQDELDRDFDSLANQALAYRESLAAVRYIAAVHGETGLKNVIAALAAGRTMEDAIAASLGMDYASFAKEWPRWARENMQ